MSKRLKYACIGAGRTANKRHLNEYSKIGNVEIVAICDPDIKAAKRLATKYNVPNIYTNYQDMFSKQVLDFVSVCTPNHLHLNITIDALRAGLHVYCEKPLALNTEEVRQIILEKNKNKRKLMVALNNRFTNEASLLKLLGDTGFFGEIYHAKCGWERNSGIPGNGNWYTDKKLSGGGSLIDLGVHFLDLAVYLMGQPKPLSVYGATYSKFAEADTRIRVGYKSVEGKIYNVEDMAVGFVRMDNGATIDFDFSWASNIEKEVKFVHLLGTKGGASFVNGEIKLYSEHVGACFSSTPDPKTIPITQNACQHFTNCIINDLEPSSSPEQACELMKIIDGVYASALEKKEVVLTRETI